MVQCPNCGREFEGGESACPGCGRLERATTCARHGERSAEGQCVICSTAVCEECDRDSAVEFICPTHHDVPIVDGWAQVYSTSDDVQGQLIRENLRSEGLDAEILSQKDHFAVPVDLGDLSPVRVLVPAYEYQEALEILAGHMDRTGEVAFACPACGEAFDEGAATCGACGEPLPASGLSETP
jgi:hypothetical protein